MTKSRRAFLQRCVSGATGLMLSNIVQGSSISPTHLCLSLTARGGWDVTSFCDPKENVPGQPHINHWSSDGARIQTVPGTQIRYAPWANNQAFFEAFAQHMLVLNGIDSQTNAHRAAERSVWSGQLGHGYPSLGALVMSNQTSSYPLGYLSNGGYRETAGLAAYTQIDNPTTLRNLIRIRASEWTSTPLIAESEYLLIQEMQAARNARLQAQSTGVSLGFRGLESLRQLTDARASLCVTGALVLDGFDTHSNHDERHQVLYQKLTNGIQYLFDQADTFGIGSQIKLIVGSEFSRTPMYNSDDGKDHWPIGSALFMQQNAAWGGRVVGQTDEMHNGILMNPQTLAVDSSGIQFRTRHFQAVSRDFFGLSDSNIAARFPLDDDGLIVF